jgi:acyl carrier protein
MNTLETLQDILVREFGLSRDQLIPAAELVTLGVDSLDLLDLMFKIEDCYGISIRNDTPTNLVTVGDVVVYIDGLLARRPESAHGAAAVQRPSLGRDS